jgi:uncharacterized tellurite resistance protein B-like protein
MKDVINNWSKDDFKTFLLIHIANADLKISRKELQMIMSEIREEDFKRIEMVWSECNDFDCINIIRDLKNKHYPGEEGKEQLIDEMTKLAYADKQFSIYEQNFIRTIKRFL